MFASMMTSCDAIKKFLSTDLSDEEYIVGQLYADEYVKETPVQFHGTKPPKPNAGDGTPYLYGGCSTSGVDCSCFVGKIFKSVYGANLHRTANDIQLDMAKMVSRDALREGDIVFFTNSNGKVSHVGIYLKDDLFVHSSTSNGVTISSLDNSYWKKHFYKGGRHKAVKTKY